MAITTVESSLERELQAYKAREQAWRARERELLDIVEKSKRKDEFLAILSHELRNPLAPIRYALMLGKQPNATSEQRRNAGDVIERQVDLMARLLDDLLDISRISRGQVALRKKWIDLTSVVGAAIDAARPLLDKKGHALTLELPPEALRLEGDPLRLTQVLTNLLTNAAKYTNYNGKITLRAHREEHCIVLAVRDNGIGISPEMMPRIFDIFAQATPDLHRSEGGLGIGLALVKAFVELHGGRVEAHSKGRDHGSEFIVRLPIGTAIVPERRGRTVASGDARPLRILVADDNADSCETCGTLLELWGHEVRTARNGREALAEIESFEPDVALLDIGMPLLNGYDVARQLRASGRAITLIAVTGWAQEDDKQQAVAAGFDYHLTKPLDPARLQPLLETL
jgi:CheY-like chemotaxis protein